MPVWREGQYGRGLSVRAVMLQAASGDHRRRLCNGLEAARRPRAQPRFANCSLFEQALWSTKRGNPRPRSNCQRSSILLALLSRSKANTIIALDRAADRGGCKATTTLTSMRQTCRSAALPWRRMYDALGHSCDASCAEAVSQ